MLPCFLQKTSLEPTDISDFPLDTYSLPASKSVIKSLIPSLALQQCPKLPPNFSPSLPGCTFLWFDQSGSFPVLNNKQTNQPALQLLPFIYRKKNNLNSDLTFRVFYFATVYLASIFL